MLKKKSKKYKKPILVDLHMYGIFDTKKNTIIKISLDPTDIQMEIALMGGLKGNLQECEFDIALKI
jgi:hypothetical protein